MILSLMKWGLRTISVTDRVLSLQMAFRLNEGECLVCLNHEAKSLARRFECESGIKGVGVSGDPYRDRA